MLSLHMRRPLLLLGLFALAAGMPGAARAQDPFGGDPKGDAPDAQGGASVDESTPLYLKGKELTRKGKWKEAQKTFRELLAKYPESCHRADAEARGGDNCYMGCVKIHESGPPSRRIDMTVMGDGFTIAPEDQKLEEEWAKACLDVLWSEAAYEEYKDYFNYYYVRLVSKDEGVDKIYTEEERLKLEEKNRRRAKKKKPEEFDTAIDCKAAGGQGQVVADRDLVYHWLNIADVEVPGCGDDGLVIAFARFGKLGMAGGGIANVGKPDESVTVHEVGHAFVQLLDEYANQPGPPTFPVRAANVTSDKNDVPWQHFLDAKTSGIGVIEGGGTYQKGVWRPAPTCAMNAAGARGYCAVCREATVLRIYNYVNPIDVVAPDPTLELKVVAGDDTQIEVVPMQPRTHDLQVEWFVERVPDSEPGPRPREQTTGQTLDGIPGFGGYTGGDRGFGREGAMYEYPPLGELSEMGKVLKRDKKNGTRFVFPVGKLPPGRWTITAKVWDQSPWVLKDEQHLLEEREMWWVTVAPKS